jgi:hypothetical protein
MKTLSCRLIIAFAGCVMLSSCAMQKSISGKNRTLSAESLDLIREKRVYTFWYFDPAKEKDVVKISYKDSIMIAGNIVSTKRKGEPFSMSRKDIIQNVYSITSISGEGIFGNFFIAGLVITAGLFLIGYWLFYLSIF